ncbi:hypothetical protein L227DRAFT_561968 [Lentinus tigrinus ALCF2SS1-6]|uniref:DUF6532 domain-containing protein n=1 Tax=Lentinus tigrinus ALCF2SS1-6 TaxID=1328759 RepID=A0A5C2SFW5_9APHY|nr:hypothetical protein L227DRAFT_561968 [Lentinus tigrinus ALCF2SS1-6]
MPPKPRAIKKKGTTNPASKRATQEIPSTASKKVTRATVAKEPTPGTDAAQKATADNGHVSTATTLSKQVAPPGQAPNTRKRASSNTNHGTAQATPKKAKQPVKANCKAQSKTAQPEDESSGEDLIPVPLHKRRAQRKRKGDDKRSHTIVPPPTVDSAQDSQDDGHADLESDHHSAQDRNPSASDGELSADEDGLDSEDPDALAAQLAAEKPRWTKSNASPNRRRKAPPTYDDIGVRRSAASKKFRDLRIELSSGASESDADVAADRDGQAAENSDEDEAEEEEEEVLTDPEWMGVLTKQKAAEKASKAIPPLLPPTAQLERPVWKATNVQTPNRAAHATPRSAPTAVLSAQLAQTSADMTEPWVQNVRKRLRGLEEDKVTDGAEDLVDDDDSEDDMEEIPAILPAARYQIVRTNGRPVSLFAQHPHVQHAVRAALPSLEAHLVHDDPFPDGITLGRNVTDALINNAGRLGYTGLEEALRMNDAVSRPLATLVKQRISTFRGGIKKIADANVAAFYNLVPNQCAPLVSALFDHLAYNFPFTWDATSETVNVQWHKPYGHAVYPAMLRVSFFTGTAAIGTQYPDLFNSSLDNRAEEKEISIPMLALVGTAIHAALTEWKTGTHYSIPFAADAYLDVYNEHRLVLSGIKAKNPRAFHSLMHRLYREASGVTPAASTSTTANEMLSRMDWDAMEVDP